MKILLFLFLLCFEVMASMLPESSIKAPLRIKNSSLTEARFNTLLDQIVETYTDVFREYGMARLIVTRNWESDNINASASRSGSTFLINAFGGLGRYEPITDDAFILIMCHEVGHLIGGAPTYKPGNSVSSEGQADYFSTAKCFRRIAKKFPQTISTDSDIHPLAKIKCEEAFGKNSKNPSRVDIDICLRSSLAQEAVARTISLLAEIDQVPAIDTPDPSERNLIIFNGYPSPQCRVDTLFEGSLCHVNENELLEMDKYNKGVCSIPNGDDLGIRPRCWYVSREDD